MVAIASQSQLGGAMSELETEIITILQHANLRVTPQRQATVKQMLQMPAHFSVDELVMALYEQKVKTSRATIYRLIPALVQLGALREVVHSEEHSHYEVVRDQAHHEHLICQRCGWVIEFACPAIEGAIVGVCEEHRFRQYQHNLEIVGLCQRCQKVIDSEAAVQ